MKVDEKLLRKNFVTSPRRISPAILSLCKEINTKAEPVKVPVTPGKDAVLSECFYNVAERISRDGGSMVYGWTIWEWARVFIEAEHHAVWEKNGELIDITPRKNRQKKIVFLPDRSAAYDFVDNRRRINIKRTLGEFASADNWITVTDAYQQAVEDNSVGRRVSLKKLEYESHRIAIRNALAKVVVDLAYQTKPRDRCICASGKEFRKCCSKLIRTNRSAV